MVTVMCSTFLFGAGCIHNAILAAGLEIRLSMSSVRASFTDIYKLGVAIRYGFLHFSIASILNSPDKNYRFISEMIADLRAKGSYDEVIEAMPNSYPQACKCH